MAVGVRWPFYRREERAEGGYGRLIADLSVLRASGVSGGASSAENALTGLWRRSFAAVASSHAALGPDVLADLGADYVSRGRMLMLRRAGSWVRPEHADRDSGRWSLGLPDGRAVVADSRDVLFVPWAVDVMGDSVGPFDSPAAEALRLLESALRGEAGTASAYLLPTPKPDDSPGPDEAAREMAEALRKADGKLLSVTSARDFGDPSRGWKPDEWKSRRVGADPSEGARDLHGRLVAAVVSSGGATPALVGASSDAAALREAFRTFVFLHLRPALRLLEVEAARVLRSPVQLDAGPLAAADVQGRARAFASLTGGGVAVEAALGMVGLD